MPPRFVDASVFVHAYLRSRRELRPDERAMKAHARDIVARIDAGEEVVTSSVQFSEVANLLEQWFPFEDAKTIQRGILTLDSVRILSVTRTDLIEALAIEPDAGLGTSDALAVILMRREGLREIYSFDRDFDRAPGVRRVAE